MQGILEVHFF